MQVDIGVWPFEHTVLVPIGFSDPEAIASRLQGRCVRSFLYRVSDHQQKIDDRFRGEPGREVDPIFSIRSARLPSTVCQLHAQTAPASADRSPQSEFDWTMASALRWCVTADLLLGEWQTVIEWLSLFRPGCLISS